MDTDREQAVAMTQTAEHELRERVKELNCLYGLSSLVEEPDISLEGIIQGTVDLIPPAWQYREITCARITLDDQVFSTPGYREAPWKQTCGVTVQGQRIGGVEVVYSEERPEADEGPFLKEERNLINAIAERLGRVIERHRAEETLQRNAHDLGERVKELNCLFSISSLVERHGSSLEPIVRGTVDLIPPAWQYPEITGARISVDGQAFSTAGFRETPWKQTSDIVARGEQVGVVEVCYQERRPESAEGPFLEAERHLIDAIAERLGRVVEHKQAEEARAALQEELYQVQKMEAIGTLAAGVAHDFNNLLTVIHGHTARAQRMLADDDGAVEELNAVRQATRQATEVTRSLLSLSRRLPSRKEQIDFCVAVQEAARLLGRALPATIELAMATECESPLWVKADPTQLQQILLNLAINARDAMPEGGRLRITVSQVEATSIDQSPVGSSAKGSLASLAVSDTGVGIPLEIQSKIFEPFFTTKTREEGTGLGLSIVYGMVKDHGGCVEVQSTVGEGTTITVLLPCIESGAAAEATPRTEVAPGGQGELVLLAEDHHQVRGIIALTLRALGYNVLLASDGAAALQLFRQHAEKIRLLLLDVDMPEGTGLDCLREIRKLDVETPAILMTGGVSLDDTQPDDNTTVVRKPFDMNELGRWVSTALGRLTGQETHA